MKSKKIKYTEQKLVPEKDSIVIIHTFNRYEDREQIDDLINFAKNASLVEMWYINTFRNHYKHDSWRAEAKDRGIKLHDTTIDFVYEKLKEYFNDEA
jgi:hypothetical protein